MDLKLKKKSVVFAKTDMEDFDKLREICKRYHFKVGYYHGDKSLDQKPYYTLGDCLSTRTLLPESIVISNGRDLNIFVHAIIRNRFFIEMRDRGQLVDDIIKEMRRNAWTLN